MTLYDFFKLKEEQQKDLLPALKVLKPIPNYTRRHWFKKRTHGVRESITELTFGEVNSIKRQVMSLDAADKVAVVRMVFKDEPLLMDVFRFYGCLRFLTLEAERVMQMERAHWNTEPTENDAKWDMAGGKELEKFGDLPMIDSLAGGEVLKYNDIEGLNYLEAHYILWYRATQQNIQQRFQKLMTNK
nr:hypothetical protein [uncultured Capnocytophaga sp.]